MTGDALIVFVILALTVAAFVSDRFRLDVVALSSAAALVLAGILTPQQAIAGFGDPLVIMIAALFVVSGAMFRTGVAERVGVWLGRVAGESEARLILLIMLVTGALSSVMSSTGTVAVMLPVVVALGWQARVSPSKLLIPLAFASLLGGMVTLIGTPPNVVVSEQLVAQGRAPFAFFDFTPVGAVMLALGIAFMVLVGRRWLPSRAPLQAGERTQPIGLAELADRYGLPAQVFWLHLPVGHPLEGAALFDLGWPARYGVQVLALDAEPPARPAWARGPVTRSKPLSNLTRIARGDRLLVQGDAERVRDLALDLGLRQEALARFDDDTLPRDLGVIEVLPTPRSRWLGSTLRDLNFRERHHLQVVGIARGAQTLQEGLADARLRFGDTLLVQGPRAAIERLRSEHTDAVVLSEPVDPALRAARGRAPIAIAVMLAMLIVMTTGWLPTVVAVGLAALAMVMFGALSMEDAYASINWQSIVLIAAILPMATALQITGGMQVVVDALVALVGPYGPRAMLLGLFVLTSLASQVMSNTATAVLLAPIAFASAATLSVAPEPLLMTVGIAASTSFATPVASPVNTLVFGVGQYRFGDFVRVGVALQLLVLIATLLVVPMLFPF